MIVAAVSLKELAQVEQRMWQGLLGAEQQSGARAFHPPVPIDERMDRLKLIVNGRQSYEQWQVRVRVK